MKSYIMEPNNREPFIYGPRGAWTATYDPHFTDSTYQRDWDATNGTWISTNWNANAAPSVFNEGEWLKRPSLYFRHWGMCVIITLLQTLLNRSVVQLRCSRSPFGLDSVAITPYEWTVKSGIMSLSRRTLRSNNRSTGRGQRCTLAWYAAHLTLIYHADSRLTGRASRVQTVLCRIGRGARIH